MTQPEVLESLLEAVARGEVSIATALEKLKHFPFEPVEDFAKIDHHRQLRTGFPEVIWGPGKTPAQIAQIMAVMSDRSPAVMATRIEPAVYEQLKEQVPGLRYYRVARICALGSPELIVKYSGTISILTAGTADLPVAEEAAITAELCGFHVQRLWDVGVAGIHRLLSHRQLIDQADVLIVVAGMEGALPSVVAGMADCPVIAVPTSVGYGASFGGVAPLLTMLNSCATGIGVVNIDNGFGAAILAGQILRTANKFQTPLPLQKEGRGSIERRTAEGKEQQGLASAQKPSYSSRLELAYAHDQSGEKIAGEITTLIDAVRQGAKVRLVIYFPGKYEYATEAQNLWLKDGIVYAQNTTQGSVEFQGEVLAFQEDACHSMMVASSQGDLDVIRWLVGKHKQRGHTCHKVAISWFVN